MNDTSETLLMIPNEVAIVPSTIRPNLSTFAMAHVTAPIAGVLDLGLMERLVAPLYLEIAIADEFLAVLVAPLKFSQVLQLLGNHRVLIVRRVAAILA